jgi:parallel beta-helix repeat protein
MLMRTIFTYIILLVVLTGIANASAPEYVPGELLVRFAPKPDGRQMMTAEREQILASMGGGTITQSFSIVPGLTLVKLPPEITVEDVLKTFKSTNGILNVQPNYILHATSTFPNDPNFMYQWGLHNEGQPYPQDKDYGGGFLTGTPGADINAPAAWDITHDACDIIVAVIDTGVDYNHPDLAPNMWTDANGHHGYDFCTCSDHDCTDSSKPRDPDPMDDHYHGTHVAGIIGARGNNNIGVTGVCWNTKIMALKFLNYAGSGKTSDAIDAIGYAIVHGAKVINASWGSRDSQSLKDAIDAADANGVLFIACAGNSHSNDDWYGYYPSSYNCNNIIAVMATGAHDEEAWFSNYGPISVDLAAPGADIFSTFPTFRTYEMNDCGYDVNYETISGTSMAAPYVAGACALLWSYRPYLTHNEVKEGILESVDVLPSLAYGYSGGPFCLTGGRLNLYKTLCYKPHRFSLTMDNNDPNNGCVDPCTNKNLTFDIYWNTNGQTDTGMMVFDQLPNELDFNSSPQACDYNSFTRTVKWNISGSSGHIVLNTNVTQWAAPGEIITNNVVMEGDSFRNRTSWQVSVCNWDGSIIYVDKDANGCKNGTNWNDAYNDLQEAMSAARELSPAITDIWVAAGTYKPVNDVNIPDYTDANFALPDNVALIGHFGGVGTYETSPSQRNFADSNNETILDGQVGGNYWEAVNYIIKGQSIDSGLIDGFTIKGSYKGDGGGGIYLNNANVSILNCKIRDNKNYGIYAINNSSPDIHNCTFSNNSEVDAYFNYCRPEISSCTFDGNNLQNNGVYTENDSSISISIVDSKFERHGSCSLNVGGGTATLTGSTFDSGGPGLVLYYATTATMTDCSVFNLSGRSMDCYSSNLTISNSTISGGGSSSDVVGLLARGGCNLTLQNSVIRYCGSNGVELHGNYTTTIKNNWIHNNGAAGIYFEYQNEIPIVRNNTIYANNMYGIWSSGDGEDPNIVNCIIYGNEINDLYWEENGSFSTVNYCLLQHSRTTGTGNITGSPGFMNPSDSNDLHIAATSQCKNAGDPNINYDGETDIDGEPRVKYGRVDIGGDEYYWSKADYDNNEIVNFADFAKLAAVWQQNDPCKSLDADDKINIYDLDLFCDDWLWEAGWTHGQWMMSMGEGGAGMSMAMQSSSLLEANGLQTETGDDLMLSDAESSFAAASAGLQARIRKFYDIVPNTTTSQTEGDMNTSAAETTTPSESTAQMSSQVTVQEPVDNQQQSMLMNEGGTPAVWLVYDGNMMPQYGDEITVYVHSDANLIIMVLAAAVTGDANITSAMDENDCNNFGWDYDWSSNPYIDPDGWVEIEGISLDSFFNGTPMINVSGTVGYFKFRYYGGQVSVSITEDSTIYDNNEQSVLFSTEPLIFGSDPNE